MTYPFIFQKKCIQANNVLYFNTSPPMPKVRSNLIENVGKAYSRPSSAFDRNVSECASLNQYAASDTGITKNGAVFSNRLSSTNYSDISVGKQHSIHDHSINQDSLDQTVDLDNTLENTRENFSAKRTSSKKSLNKNPQDQTVSVQIDHSSEDNQSLLNIDHPKFSSKSNSQITQEHFKKRQFCSTQV